MNLLWYSLGVLTGIGLWLFAGVIYAAGKRDGRKEKENGNHDLD